MIVNGNTGLTRSSGTRRGHLAAGCVQVAGVQRRAEPAVRCGRARLQRRGEREFPCGENENGVSSGTPGQRASR